MRMPKLTIKRMMVVVVFAALLIYGMRVRQHRLTLASL